MEKPKFEEKISKKDYIERTSSQPIKSFVPHQALNLSELMSRFEKGQRLNVHNNFAPMSNFTEGKIVEEDFDDAPPDDVHDVVDVHNYYEAHQAHKQDFAKRQKEKKSAASITKQAPSEPQPSPAES